MKKTIIILLLLIILLFTVSCKQNKTDNETISSTEISASIKSSTNITSSATDITTDFTTSSATDIATTSTTTSAASFETNTTTSSTQRLTSEEIQKKIRETLEKIDKELAEVPSIYISPEDKERYQQTEMKLLEIVSKNKNELEAMHTYYKNNNYLHNDIGYIEKNGNEIKRYLKTDLKDFDKYVDMIFNKTDFKKIVFKKNCIYLVLDTYQDKYVTLTMYSKKFDYKKKYDPDIHKGYFGDYFVYEETTIDF